MRLSVFHILLAAASLVTYAAASPIRVVVVSSHEEALTNVRFADGKPVVAETPWPIAHFAPLPVMALPQPSQGAGRHRGCNMKNTAVAVSNKFREMLGLPLIAAPQHNDPVPAEPFAENFTDLEFKPTRPTRPNGMPNRGGPGIVHIAPGRHMGHRRPHSQLPFFHRVHRALMVLGPWEGRAVAFVLGCGIGVLFRMFWVMTILLFRAFRGSRSNDETDVHEVLVFEADAEDILVPPPQYTDEKVALVAVEEKKPETTA